MNAVPIQMDAELLVKSAYKARKAVLEADLDDIWGWSSLQLQSEWGLNQSCEVLEKDSKVSNS